VRKEFMQKIKKMEGNKKNWSVGTTDNRKSWRRDKEELVKKQR
jgi:hypothetical protein